MAAVVLAPNGGPAATASAADARRGVRWWGRCDGRARRFCTTRGAMAGWHGFGHPKVRAIAGAPARPPSALRRVGGGGHAACSQPRAAARSRRGALVRQQPRGRPPLHGRRLPRAWACWSGGVVNAGELHLGCRPRSHQPRAHGSRWRHSRHRRAACDAAAAPVRALVHAELAAAASPAASSRRRQPHSHGVSAERR